MNEIEIALCNFFRFFRENSEISDQTKYNFLAYLRHRQKLDQKALQFILDTLKFTVKHDEKTIQELEENSRILREIIETDNKPEFSASEKYIRNTEKLMMQVVEKFNAKAQEKFTENIGKKENFEKQKDHYEITNIKNNL